jgi:hypothetical protein
MARTSETLALEKFSAFLALVSLLGITLAGKLRLGAVDFTLHGGQKLHESIVPANLDLARMRCQLWGVATLLALTENSALGVLARSQSRALPERGNDTRATCRRCRLARQTRCIQHDPPNTDRPVRGVGISSRPRGRAMSAYKLTSSTGTPRKSRQNFGR